MTELKEEQRGKGSPRGRRKKRTLKDEEPGEVPIVRVKRGRPRKADLEARRLAQKEFSSKASKENGNCQHPVKSDSFVDHRRPEDLGTEGDPSLRDYFQNIRSPLRDLIARQPLIFTLPEFGALVDSVLRQLESESDSVIARAKIDWAQVAEDVGRPVSECEELWLRFDHTEHYRESLQLIILEWDPFNPHYFEDTPSAACLSRFEEHVQGRLGKLFECFAAVNSRRKAQTARDTQFDVQSNRTGAAGLPTSMGGGHSTIGGGGGTSGWPLSSQAYGAGPSASAYSSSAQRATPSPPLSRPSTSPTPLSEILKSTTSMDFGQVKRRAPTESYPDGVHMRGWAGNWNSDPAPAVPVVPSLYRPQGMTSEAMERLLQAKSQRAHTGMSATSASQRPAIQLPSFSIKRQRTDKGPTSSHQSHHPPLPSVGHRSAQELRGEGPPPGDIYDVVKQKLDQPGMREKLENQLRRLYGPNKTPPIPPAPPNLPTSAGAPQGVTPPPI